MDVAVDIMEGRQNHRAGNHRDAYRISKCFPQVRELVLMAYDYVLAGCNMRDKTKASRGLAELIDARFLSRRGSRRAS